MAAIQPDRADPAAQPAARRSHEAWVALLASARLPALICDLEAFDRNASALAGRAAPLPLRLATKSIRCRALIERALGWPGWRGVMCFSAREAAWLASHGVDDLLVAYPTLQADALAACARAVAGGATIRLVVDDLAQARAADRAAAAHGCTLELCVDVDMSVELGALWFGVRRSPLREPGQVAALAAAIAGLGHVALVGMMGYEAQFAGLRDRVPGQALSSLVIQGLKRATWPLVVARRREVARALEAAGIELRIVNGAGTGSLERSRTDPTLTELTAGSGLYSPALFEGYEHFSHVPALYFALELTRAPAPGIWTCAGGGYPASGPPGWDRLPTPWLPAGARLLAREGAGEVQTPIALAPSAGAAVELGGPAIFRAAKAGEICERFASILLVADDRIVDEVPTYRGEGVCWA